MHVGVNELTEQVTPLDLLWGRAGSQLCERIYEADTLSQKLALYQEELLKHVTGVPHYPRLQYALSKIDQPQGNVSVKWLATQTNLSQKQFERLFEHVVGMMPKRYLRLRRFQRLVSWLQRYGNAVNWTNLAATFGYYDHSHLVKDFRTFAGTTPGEFATATAGIVEVAYGQADESQNV
jgi:AraC-like DNA-binding protein